MSFIRELKRRNVFRVGMAYAVIGWLVLQLSDILISLLDLPDWIGRAAIFVLVVGFPLALIFAWAFELTPEGIKLDKKVDRAVAESRQYGRKLDYVIIGALVLALGYFVWERQQLVSPDAPIDRSIAVLPFVVRSTDVEQELFADGLTEEILNSLARTPDLQVASSTSSFVFKDSGDDIKTIAESLGVSHILEGSVRRSGETLRITARLIRASDGFELWSQPYNRQFADVIAIQEDIAIQIANALETAMDPEALAAMVSAGTHSVPAYEAYLRGKGHLVSSVRYGDPNEMLAAFSEWETAVELDPEFALAYGQIEGFWFGQLMAFDYLRQGLADLPRVELEEQWNTAIDAAIKYELNPASNLYFQARKARGNLNFRQALRISEKYLDQRPNDSRAFADHFDLMRMLSEFDQTESVAIDMMKHDERRLLRLMVLTINLRFSQNKELIREFVRYSIGQQGENVTLLYQTHQNLLWTDDIIGAGELLPLIRTSSLPKPQIALATLRQACAENRTSDAIRLFNEEFLPIAGFAIDKWMGYKTIGDDASAHEVAVAYDEQGDALRMATLLQYPSFDPRPYPNLMSRLADQGIEDRKVIDIPYRCDR